MLGGLLTLALLAPAADAFALASVHTSTAHVEDLAVDGERLWVATRGGLELYDVGSGAFRRRYDTRDGLDTAHVWTVTLRDGTPQVRTTASTCRLLGGAFSCTPAKGPLPLEPTVGPRRAGKRVTATVEVRGRRFEGTAGAGLWLGGETPRRLTPGGQPCSNHIGPMVEDGPRLWLGSFHEGLCWTDDGVSFSTATDAPRMINDLAAVDGVLWVAATEGLFRSDDGVRFERERSIRPRGVNGLAADGDVLWVTTPGALWQVPLGKGRTTAFSRPGRTRAIQGLVRGAGVSWLPTEDRGVLRVDSQQGVTHFDLAAGLSSSWFLAAAVDGEGRVYAGSLRDGVTVIEPDGTHHRVGGLPDAWVFDVTRIEDTIMVGTQGGAAAISDGGVVSVPDLPHPNVHGFARYRGQLWVATEGGLAVYETRSL
jgi:ligand-binding sensor domain-containing protein